MNKKIGIYLIAWLLVLGLFNVACFISPSELGNFEKFDATFWSSYGFITASFLGNLLCSGIAFRAKNSTKLFYNIPLITVSFYGLVAMLVAGVLCMLIPDFPVWLGISICYAVLAFTSIAVIMSFSTAEIAEKIDNDVMKKTLFINSLRAEAEGLVVSADDDEIRKACQLVYDSLKYSDPVSSGSLLGIEEEIKKKFIIFSDCVSQRKPECVDRAKDLVAKINERNKKCKWIK